MTKKNQPSAIDNPKAPNILVVDDDELVRRMLGRMLERQGYGFIPASDAAEARKCLDAQAFKLVLCDVKMPGESGIDLAKDISARYEDTALIMITAVDDPNVARDVIEAGIYGYLIKPFNPNEVVINIQNALRRRELEMANRRYRRDLEQMVEERTHRLQKAMEGIIRAMSLTVESKDPYTSGHQQRVAGLAGAMAEEMGFSSDRVQSIRLAGMVHDLGKISVPTDILTKPTRITDIEFALIKTHAQVGYDILKEIEFPWPIAEMVHQHHEKMDGSGYPRGLTGADILPEARILCVADVVEAMASHRPYRPALGLEKAMEEISANSGKRYDPKAVKVCLRLIRKNGFTFDR